jgi:hypothetical protein
MSVHSQLTGFDLHEVYHFVQETDPGAIGSNLYWLKVSTGEVKRRNGANSAWTTVGSVSPLTTKGDIIVFDGTQAIRLPVGNNGDVLMANSGEPSGLGWGLGGGGGGGGGVYVPTPPTGETSTGTTGTYSVDTNYLYICTATNFWKRVQLSAFPQLITLTYVSDGDLNGVFTFMGKGKTIGGSWSNPATSGQVTATQSAGGTGNVTMLTDHTTNDQWITPAANSWYQWDLGPTQQLILNKWSFRQRTLGAVTPGSDDCTIKGSNDGVTFTTIDARTGAQVPSSADAWGTFTVSGTPAQYRYFRIQQTFNDYFCCGEIELYGDLYYAP